MTPIVVAIVLIYSCCGMSAGIAPRMPRPHLAVRTRSMSEEIERGLETVTLKMAAVDPSMTYTGLGLATAVGIYQKVIIGRFLLSWFPDLYRTFPFLSPIYTVTEPYLVFFRRQIPAIGGFDISSIPALLILDLAGNAAASLGCEIPDDLSERIKKMEARNKASIVL